MKNLSSLAMPWLLAILLIVGSVSLYSCKKRIPESQLWDPVTHVLLGEEESCMDCHKGMTGFVPSHDPQTIGCSPCHGGNPRLDRKEAAHDDMLLVPGNLGDIFKSCGATNCHQDIAARVNLSMMTTMSGVISIDKYVFGDSDSLSASYHIGNLQNKDPSDSHLRNLCASCHLGNQKTIPAPVSEKSRGGGCNACHTNYSQDARESLNKYMLDRDSAHLPIVHPASSLDVGNDHCFGCHSRSGRISTNYEGWHETVYSPDSVKGDGRYRLLEDGRVFSFVQPDIHHLAGMSCIDCHTAREIMGDSIRYKHKEQAVKIRCSDCHFEGPGKTIPYQEVDEESKKILALRRMPWNEGEYLIVENSGDALLHTFYHSEDSLYLIGKSSKKRFSLSPPAEICTKGTAHDQLSCDACHTSWAPQCLGCHTAYNKEGKGFDLLAKKPTNGRWDEYLDAFLSDLPPLGVYDGAELGGEEVREIKTFIAGMILTIDASEFTNKPADSVQFHRLFAPSSAHTTARKGRDCKSCHNNPSALGYGRGTLDYLINNGSGRWVLQSDYEYSPYDGLPQDAWIEFLEEPRGQAATRPFARPFNLAEQKRILLVGSCLECHRQDSQTMMDAIEDFDQTLSRISDSCILPLWD